MSNVVLAEDTLLGRHVALKRMHIAGDPRRLLRLRREALIGASVSHPNLVSIYDIVDSEDGDSVIVMEYVPGETLRDVFARGERLSVPAVLEILDGVAAGLEAIHRRGIVHRDVKPGNILLGRNGEVKLADLGIATAPDRTRITTAGSVLGTFSYMAPEQLSGERPTPATDVYALSAVAFEALSGRKVRRESNPMALAHAIATQPAPDLRDAWPEATPEAAELLKRGMSREPSVRPRSARELVSRLREALQPQATAAMASGLLGAAMASGAALAASGAPAPAMGYEAAAPAAAPEAAAPVMASQAVAPAKASQAAAPGKASAVAEPANAAEAPAREKGSDAPQGEAQPVAFHTYRGSARPHRKVLAPALLGLAAAVIAAIVLTSLGGSHRTARVAQSSSATSHRRTASRRHARASRARHSHSHSHSHKSVAAASAPAGPSSSADAAQASSPSTLSTPSTGAIASLATGPASSSQANPVTAVETFYHLAASHDYPAAWALADPTFRNQLRGYVSFEAGQQADRSITFDSARVLSQSTYSAVVAVRTTSVRQDGTQHCAGTVDLLRPGSSSGWLLHLIDINCG